MASKIRIRHCFYCGEQIGVYADFDPLDTCGKPECEKEARAVVRDRERDDLLDRERR